MSVMDMLFWNCRGAGNNKFRISFKELVAMHKPDLIVLMETKVDLSSIGMFFNSLGYTASSHVDPIGKSEGIWMLWNTNNVNVRVSEANSQMILATISKQNYPDWMLAAVYANPNPRIREELWDSLENIAPTNQLPWLLAGDFNDHASPEEKRSYSTNQNLSQSLSRSRKFVNHINNCNLLDLGCTGPSLTWSNNRQGWAKTLIRLDRALCNAEWRTRFPDGFVHTLPRTYSDYFPMLVHTQGKSPHTPLNRQFKFQAAWIAHEGFRGMVHSNWTHSNNNLLVKLHNMASFALDWNKNVFGNIFRNKRWLLGRIEGIQKSQARLYTHNLLVLEKDLVDQYNQILYHEDLLWFQKSRSNWITQGDRNTKFFHLTTLIKRRKLQIDVLKNEHEVWIDEPNDLKNLVLFFKKLFDNPIAISLAHWCNKAVVMLRQARELSNICHIPLTADLGKYLGVPILHQQANRSHFNFILEKIQNKLAGWKVKVLSLVGRTTLVQSVTAAIPTYTMQTMALPKRVCNDIDRMNRNFLWGDTVDKKKIHLMSWDEVCISKKFGELGLKKASEQNIALLSKIG
ncbi:hypothetical protein ACSBR1_008521 [Camellia fascicularis]